MYSSRAKHLVTLALKKKSNVEDSAKVLVKNISEILGGSVDFNVIVEESQLEVEKQHEEENCVNDEFITAKELLDQVTGVLNSYSDVSSLECYDGSPEECYDGSREECYDGSREECYDGSCEENTKTV